MFSQSLLRRSYPSENTLHRHHGKDMVREVAEFRCFFSSLLSLRRKSPKVSVAVLIFLSVETQKSQSLGKVVISTSPRRGTFFVYCSVPKVSLEDDTLHLFPDRFCAPGVFGSANSVYHGLKKVLESTTCGQRLTARSRDTPVQRCTATVTPGMTTTLSQHPARHTVRRVRTWTPTKEPSETQGGTTMTYRWQDAPEQS